MPQSNAAWTALIASASLTQTVDSAHRQTRRKARRDTFSPVLPSGLYFIGNHFSATAGQLALFRRYAAFAVLPMIHSRSPSTESDRVDDSCQIDPSFVGAGHQEHGPIRSKHDSFGSKSLENYFDVWSNFVFIPG